MGRVDQRDRWNADGTVIGLQVAVHRFLRAWGLQVIGERTGVIHARRGSWVGSVLGRYAPDGWLPQRACIRMQAMERGVAVRAEIEEATVGPIGRRLTHRYRAYFERWMAELKARLPPTNPS